jgi:uncharacterized DUF497 family protein
MKPNITPTFLWDEVNLRKVEAHDIDPEEVEEVFTDPDQDVRRTRTGEGQKSASLRRYQIIGRTDAGRLLKVPFEIIEGKVRPVTAYDAGKRDYQLYWKA